MQGRHWYYSLLKLKEIERLKNIQLIMNTKSYTALYRLGATYEGLRITQFIGSG